MKKNWFLLLAFASICLFISCDKSLDEFDNNQKKIEAVNNGSILKFKDQSVFDETVAKLKQMNQKELNEWTSSLGITSLHSIYMDALTEAGEMEASAEAYQNLKTKYSKSLYFPEYKKDYGVYLPVSNRLYATFLNADGKVMVGNETKDFADIKDYQSLQKTGVALYDEEKASTELRASNFKYVSSGQYIGPVYDSGWNIYEDPYNPDYNHMSRVTVGRYLYQCGTYYPYWTVLITIDSRRLIFADAWTTEKSLSEISGTVVPEKGSPRNITPYYGSSYNNYYISATNTIESDFYYFPHPYYVLDDSYLGESVGTSDEGYPLSWAYEITFDLNTTAYWATKNHKFTLPGIIFAGNPDY